MYRTVYYHKTTYALEEACRQLLRRLRDKGVHGLAANGDDIRSIATTEKIGEFTDAYVDQLVYKAAESKDGDVEHLARALLSRRPPRLLKEVAVLEDDGTRHHAGSAFRRECKHRLAEFAGNHNLGLSRFLFCETRPLRVEVRGSRLSEQQARDLDPLEKEELIKVFLPDQDEPTSIVSIPYSLIGKCSGQYFQFFRLYVVTGPEMDEATVRDMRREVARWDEA